MSKYNTYFTIVVPVESSNGIDLEEYRMDEMTREIEEVLNENFPDLKVLPLGFELTE